MTTIAPYLQEAQAEKQWAFILRNVNVSNGMANPAIVSRLAGNWRNFATDMDLSIQGLAAVPAIAAQFKSYLDGKKTKSITAIDPKDIEVFVANKVWEAKIASGAVLDGLYSNWGFYWLSIRSTRGQLQEALHKAIKTNLDKLTIEESAEAFIQSVIATLSEKGDQLLLDTWQNNNQPQLPEAQ
ncbi:hypothetical protein NON20_08645 [Synechocystis sp. B12]|nr:hypothetical protein NON20_08645 [Synechocystis sp. B12]